MAILENTVIALSKVDQLKGVAEALDRLVKADNVLDVSAACARLAAEVSTGLITVGMLRPALSGIRLGLAVSGRIHQWEALTNAVGILGGMSAGALIDEINDLNLGSKAYDWLHPDSASRNAFSDAQTFVPRVDPLTLDLDNDGLETVSISTTKPVLFDHNGDGIKTSTGWVRPDDGFLAFDRNGNGMIDDGTELFGDSTALYSGGRAADGFDALAQEDSNVDGLVDSGDVHWSQLKIWRDLNQDGVSQSNELSCMEQAGIASFDVAKTVNSQVLANGNQIADLGSFVRTSGTIGTSGTAEEVGQMADINLAEDTFYRQFNDKILLADGVAALPDIYGSGKVRDLREAASISPELKNLLTQFSQATTRQEQRAILGQLLEAWADTSGMAGSMQERVAGEYSVSFQSVGSQLQSNTTSEDWSAIVDAWERKMHVLEAFNGRYFFRLPNEDAVGSAALQGLTVVPVAGTGSGGSTAQINVALSQGQVTLLEQSYDALFQSVYLGLYMQTRFRSTLGEVELVFGETGVSMDFSAVEQHFEKAVMADAVNGLGDLIDFNRGLKGAVPASDWAGPVMLAQYMARIPVTEDLLAMYLESGIRVVGQGGGSASGTAADDIILADAAGSVIHAKSGNDTLAGRKGDDQLNGEEGNDLLVGSAGNDLLYGGIGNDTYVLAKGDGVDFIDDYDTTAGNTDVAQFTDVASTEVTSLERRGNELVMKYGAADQLTVIDYFNVNYPGSRLERFSFNDGVSWDDATIKARVITTGSTGYDSIHGYNDGTNRIYALGGNDYLVGGSRADLIDGGTGDDTLYGRAGDDELVGGAGADTLKGEEGSDVLVGGTGNDLLYGGIGNDTYLLARGDGFDMIDDYDTTAGNTDVVQFTDVASTEVTSLERRGNELVMKYGVADQLTVIDYFNVNYPGSRLERFSFSDGVTWNDAAIKARVITNGTSAADYLTGYDNVANRLFGFGGDDKLYGAALNDVINGGAGDDYLEGYGGDDILVGGEGKDTVSGGEGNDVIDGGFGDDLLYGGNGADRIRFGKGYGTDTFGSANTAAFRVDTVDLFDIATGEVSLLRSGDTLKVVVEGSTDSLAIGYYFGAGTFTTVSSLRFVDGTVWDDAAIKARVITNGTAAADNLTGYDDATNRLFGFGGDDKLYGAGLNDVINGGAGDDYLEGYGGDDILVGGEGRDTVSGGEGNDVIDGGFGDDLLYGGNGADRIRFGKGYGTDTFGSVNTAAFRVDTVDLFDIATGEVSLLRSGDTLKVMVEGGSDSLAIGYYFSAGTFTTVNNLRFADGTVWDDAAIKARVITHGTAVADSLTGYDDGANRLYGFDGDDKLYGGAEADFINGGAGNDSLYGYSGNDILQGGAGQDVLDDTTGNNVLDGGVDNDVLSGGGGNELFIGGAGNDVIATGAGVDLIAFNRGDGQDTVLASSGRDDTISLGGGISYADLSLSKVANDLVLTTGAQESITLKDWYVGSANRSVASLQFVVEGSSDYDAASADSLHNQKIAQFDFEAMVSRFDAAQAASPGLSNWALSSALLDFHLGGSDTAAIGGDLAYQYGRHGDLSGMSVNAAQSLLAAAQFASASQALRGDATQRDLSPRLM